MNNYSPYTALLVFFGIVILGYIIFRPAKGWFWKIKSRFKSDQKTITEDILKQLYHFENSGKKGDINDLTNSLEFNNKHIVEAVNYMTVNELIENDGAKLKLTHSGRNYAIKIVRVHRLWEKYLAEKTGFEKEEWHSRAEVMEHKLNEEETDNLADTLGNPLYDPHGDPIPTEKGKIIPLEGQTLTSLKENSTGKIIHIEDEPEVIYKEILSHNIHIGSQIKLVKKNKNKIVFISEGERFILSPIAASNILVKLNEKNLFDKEWSRLSRLRIDEKAQIVGISKECRGENRRRLLDLGFVKGAEIGIDLLNPLKNPKAYKIKGTSIALRNDQASKILIKKIKDEN